MAKISGSVCVIYCLYVHYTSSLAQHPPSIHSTRWNVYKITHNSNALSEDMVGCCVAGCIEPTFQITKQPRSRVVDEGSSFTLQCRAEFKAGITGTLEYQWYHNETAIRGANSAIHARLVS